MIVGIVLMESGLAGVPGFWWMFVCVGLEYLVQTLNANYCLFSLGGFREDISLWYLSKVLKGFVAAFLCRAEVHILQEVALSKDPNRKELYY
jgi:hypothetical protein